MNIIGINCYHGDASAALVSNGNLLFAIEEERLTRVKHCAGLPIAAVQACLSHANLHPSDIDIIAVIRRGALSPRGLRGDGCQPIRLCLPRGRSTKSLGNLIPHSKSLATLSGSYVHSRMTLCGTSISHKYW